MAVVGGKQPTARCFTEKKTITIKDPEYVMNKNGNVSVKGVCPNDGTKVQQFVSVNDPNVPEALKRKVAEFKKKHAK